MPDTSSNSKRIAKNTIALYTRQILVMLVTLYTSRVILNTLGVSDFGIYNVVGGVVTMFSFITGTMASASQRYIAYDIAKKDAARTKETFSLIMLSYMMLAMLFLLLAESVAVWFLNTKMNIPPDRMEAANWVLQFSIFSFFITIFQMPYLSMCIAKEHMNVYAYVSIAEAVLRLLVVYLLMISDYDKLKVYAVLMFLTTVVIFLLYRWYCIRKFDESHYRFYYNRKRLVELTSFAWWNMIGALANVLRSQGINILLNIFFNPVVNAARGIAFQVNNAIINFSNNFYTAVKPQIVKNYATGNMIKMHNLIISSSRLAFYLLLILSLPVYLNAEQVLRIWLKTPPEYAPLFVKLILINTLLEVFSMPLVSGLQAHGRIKPYQLTVSIVYMLNVPISYIFLRMGYAPETPMIVNIMLYLLSFPVRLWFCHQYFGLPLMIFVFDVIIRTFLVAAFCFVVNYHLTTYVNPDKTITGLIYSVLLTVTITTSIVLMVGIKKKELHLIKATIRECYKHM